MTTQNPSYLNFAIHSFTHTFTQLIYVRHLSLTHCRHGQQRQFGIQYLAQGHFGMKNGGDWD